MMDLVITGWKPGLKTISLMEVLRKSCGMGLKQSKEAVDGLLDGREIRLAGLGQEVAATVRNDVEALGATCQ
jgi:ribosomal protein L7/L12